MWLFCLEASHRDEESRVWSLKTLFFLLFLFHFLKFHLYRPNQLGTIWNTQVLNCLSHQRLQSAPSSCAVVQLATCELWCVKQVVAPSQCYTHFNQRLCPIPCPVSLLSGSFMKLKKRSGVQYCMAPSGVVEDCTPHIEQHAGLCERVQDL